MDVHDEHFQIVTEQHLEDARAEITRLTTLLDDAETQLSVARDDNERLIAEIDDARETLQPFEAVSLAGYDAHSTRPVTITVAEGDLCQAWQVLTTRSRWRPVVSPRAATATPSFTCGRGLPAAERAKLMTALKLIADTAATLETLAKAMECYGERLRSKQIWAIAGHLRWTLNTLEAKP